jgi:hypothetical protein
MSDTELIDLIQDYARGWPTKEVKTAQIQEALAAHDAELTERVRAEQRVIIRRQERTIEGFENNTWVNAAEVERARAEQREADAQIAEDAAIGWNHDYDNGCFVAATAIREAGKQ